MWGVSVLDYPYLQMRREKRLLVATPVESVCSPFPSGFSAAYGCPGEVTHHATAAKTR
jgi:hypothetical protein